MYISSLSLSLVHLSCTKAHLDGLGARGLDEDGDVVLELLVEPRLDVVAGHELALLAREGRVVGPEGHGQRWGVHHARRQRLLEFEKLEKRQG